MRNMAVNQNLPGNNEFQYESYSGTRIDSILTYTLNIIDNNPSYDQIFVMAGVCDLFRKRGPVVNIDFDFCVKMPYSLLSLCQFFSYQVELRSRNTKVIICPIFGVDINMYNEYLQGPAFVGRVIDLDQKFLNYIVKLFNNEVHVFNTRYSLPTPRFDRRIIRNIPGRGTIVNYDLTYDGCHQDTVLNRVMYSSILNTKREIENMPENNDNNNNNV